MFCIIELNNYILSCGECPFKPQINSNSRKITDGTDFIGR